MIKYFLDTLSAILIFSLFIPVITIGQQVFYVNNSDEIKAAMQQASPGDTLIMRNGEWNDERIIFSGSGTASDPITLKAETPGHVYITGRSHLRIGGEYLVVDGLYFVDGQSASGGVIEFRNGSSNPARYCRLTNSAIVDFNPESKYVDYKWISLYGEYNRVDNCYFKGKNHSGTTLVVWLDGNPNYHKIDHNYFAFRPELGENGGETIRVGTSSYSLTDSYTTVEYNYFEHCNGEIEIISNKSGHNTYRYNTFYESEGALTLRHGNFAEVYGNFFIGNNKSRTGGVRIIGEDHKVYNNYFENLEGTSFRAALSILFARPDTLNLSGYLPVERAQVINNTFINCDETFKIDSDFGDNRIIPPKDCIIANNVVLSEYQIIDYDDEPINLVYDSNIMYGGPLGIDNVEGIEQVNPQLTEQEDDIYRFTVSSPLYNNGSNNYSFVNEDIDGQSRDSNPDIGADEISNDEVTNRPLTADDVGVYWEINPIDPPKTIKVEAGTDSLLAALNKAEPQDTIELVTDGGIYEISQSLQINNKIFIRGAEGLTSKPVIRASSDISTLIELFENAELYLARVELDGMSGTTQNVKYLIRTDESPMTGSYKLYVSNCYLHDVAIGPDGNFFRAYEGTLADVIVFSNTIFENCGKEGIRLKDEASGKGNYNVAEFELFNCTMYNTPKEGIVIYGGDEVIYTPGPEVMINQVTFYNCGYDGKPVIDLNDCDNSLIINSIIAWNESSETSIILSSELAQIRNSVLWNVGDINAEMDARIGPKVYEFDPLFNEPTAGDFTLDSNSPALTLGSNGDAVGDLRWATNEPSFVSLNVIIYGEGEVVADPSSPTGSYEPGTVVNLTAVPESGNEFVSWSGAASGSQQTVQLEMNESKTVTAVFQNITSVEDQHDLPTEFKLKQNYPNPFNPSTTVSYSLAEHVFVSLKVFDTRGQLIKTLVEEEQPAGSYQLNWNAGNLCSGVYFLKMSAGPNIFSRKLILLK